MKFQNCHKSGCPKQHPNEITFEYLITQICKYVGIDVKDWNARAERGEYLVFWKGDSTQCPKRSACPDQNCKHQHPEWIVTQSLIPAVQSLFVSDDADSLNDNFNVPVGFHGFYGKVISSPSSSSSSSTTTASVSGGSAKKEGELKAIEFSLINVTNIRSHMAAIQEVFNRNTKQYKWEIVEAFHIQNEMLRERFFKYRKALRNKLHILPATHKVCHGTKQAGWDNIPRDGFKAEFRKRELYGSGHYFSLDPVVAHSYSNGCNMIIICDVVHESLSFESKMEYFIVPDDDAILPLYMVRYKVLS